MRAENCSKPLFEHALPTIGGEHFLVDDEPVERGEALTRNALAGGFFLEVGQEGVEAGFVILHCAASAGVPAISIAPMSAVAKVALTFDIVAPLLTVRSSPALSERG
jgi:hypothetical protein